MEQEEVEIAGSEKSGTGTAEKIAAGTTDRIVTDAIEQGQRTESLASSRTAWAENPALMLGQDERTEKALENRDLLHGDQSLQGQIPQVDELTTASKYLYLALRSVASQYHARHNWGVILPAIKRLNAKQSKFWLARQEVWRMVGSDQQNDGYDLLASIMGELEMAGATTKLDTIAEKLRKQMAEEFKETDPAGFATHQHIILHTQTPPIEDQNQESSTAKAKNWVDSQQEEGVILNEELARIQDKKRAEDELTPCMEDLGFLTGDNGSGNVQFQEDDLAVTGIYDNRNVFSDGHTQSSERPHREGPPVQRWTPKSIKK
jgi:hypothetical protein